jgi:hypothetical protein
MHMHRVTDSQKPLSVAGANVAEVTAVSQSAYPDYRITRRNGAIMNFDPRKIWVAMTKVNLTIEGGQGAVLARIRDVVDPRILSNEITRNLCYATACRSGISA